MQVELRLPAEGVPRRTCAPGGGGHQRGAGSADLQRPAHRPAAHSAGPGRLDWIATQVMRDELERVLAYPHIVSRMDFYRVDAAQVLAAFDAQARLVDIAPAWPTCARTRTTRKFIDLAAAHRAIFAEQGQGRDLHAQAPPDAGCPRGHRAGAGRKPGRSRCLKAAAAVGGPGGFAPNRSLYSSKLKSAAATSCQAPSP